MNITLEQASFIAEIVGVFVIVVSLIYLSLQLRQNNQHLEEQASTVALQIRMQNLRSSAENEHVGRLLYSHLTDQPLNDIENARRVDWLSNLFLNFQWVFDRHRAGLIRTYDSLEHMASIFRGRLERWNGADVWNESKHAYRTDFREFMDTQVMGPG